MGIIVTVLPLKKGNDFNNHRFVFIYRNTSYTAFVPSDQPFLWSDRPSSMFKI